MTSRAPAAPSFRPARWCAVATVCAAAVAIGYFPALDAGLQLPDALYGPGLAVVCGAALFARWRALLGTFAACTAAWAGVPAAVLAKVMVDVLRDPTSHTLWPFELAIALAVGAVPAAVGAVVGWALARAFRPRRD